jgi:hypothetical protein
MRYAQKREAKVNRCPVTAAALSCRFEPDLPGSYPVLLF